MAFEQRMTMLTLGVTDLGRARAFYESLGWRASSASQGDVVFFQTGSSALALYRQEALSRDLGASEAPRAGGATMAYNTRSREEVAIRLREAEAAGATVLKEPHETPWGGTVAYFADPDGHPWEITFVETFVPKDDGSIALP